MILHQFVLKNMVKNNNNSLGEAEKKYLIDGKYGITDLLDIDQLKELFDQFNKATGFTIGFLDHPALNILVATGWRDICTKFHRVAPGSLENCKRSNHILLDKLKKPGQVVIEGCKNGMVDCATPIIIEGKHIASLATGQLLLKKPNIARFKKQAKMFGYDEKAYLEALATIPVVDAKTLKDVTRFLGSMAVVLSQAGYTNLISKRTEEELKERVKDLDIVYATSKIMESDEINDALVKIVNLIPSGFQFSKLVSVRIIYNGVKFQTDNFKKSKWVQVVTISTDHKNVGKIEVFYLKEKSFTKAEELMLREVASEIGNIAERKKFNEEILKYKFIADQAPQMIAIADLQGKIVYANGSWVKHHGYSTEKELVGKNLSIFHTKKQLEVVNEFNKKLLARGRHRGEVGHVTKQGKEFLTIMDNFVLKIGGEGRAFIGIATDVTKQKEVEEELRASEEKFAKVFRSNPQAQSITDISDGRIIEVNSSCTKVLGFSHKELVGHTTLELGIWITPEDRRRFVNDLGKHGFVRNKEMVLKNKAGKIITVSMSAVLAKVVGKTYIITTFHDITEQRKFEEKLKKSEEKYRVLAEQSRDGIAIVALDGTMKYANSYLANLLGYKTKEMIGQHVLKFTHPDFRAATIEVIKHFNSGTKEMRFEAADITKDGRRIDIEDSIALIDYGGQKCGLIIVRDVSERKKMLAILEESSNRYRGLFETSRDAIMTLEPPSWYFTSGNSATLKMFKAKDEAEFLSYPPWKLSPKFQPDGQPSDKKAKEMIEYAMENGSNLFEWTHKRIGGEEFFAEVFLSKVKLGDDAFLQAIVRDITERKMSEEKIKNKTLDLERLNKVMIGRELKMVQLKKELERLKKEKI